MDEGDGTGHDDGTSHRRDPGHDGGTGHAHHAGDVDDAAYDAPPAAGAGLAVPLLARRIVLRGRVQGVGFRPFVHRLASRWGLHGWVRNVGGEVVLHVEGGEGALHGFEVGLLSEAPPFARPEMASAAFAEVLGYEIFFVEESAEGGGISVPPDVALCDDCRRELGDPNDRRHRYPFINCTQCGPRATIIASLPYDRERTSMASFPLCQDCAREYGDLSDRRYHAEPVACPRCGPKLEFRRESGQCLRGEDVRAHGRATRVHGEKAVVHGDDAPARGEDARIHGEDALARAVAVLRSGGILGVKGLGGYHLLCDATSSSAVRLLRERKRRPGKPFAVMVPRRGDDGLDAARALVELGPAAAASLISPAHPIVLAPRSAPWMAPSPAAGIAGESAPEPMPRTPPEATSGTALDVAPGLGELGVFLPYTPLHELLLADFGRPVVATSGNESGEPLSFTRGDADRYLRPLVDGFLHHDRPILRAVDDSVVRDFGDLVLPLRIGRGYAPLELPLPLPTSRARLAVGGHMKSAVALAWEDRVVLSSHLGELDRPRAVDAFVFGAESLCSLYGIEPVEILCDAHPDYASTRWARAQKLPVFAIPHHRAHASALAGEHPDVGRWLVFAWDGVGLGEDGTLWGGEVFLGAPGMWERVGSVRPFRLLGAGRAGREPLRSAQALAWELGLEVGTADPGNLARAAWERGLEVMATTAVGRIFDAAAALLLGRSEYDYEAQGPMEVETAAHAGDLRGHDVGAPIEAAFRLPVREDAGGLWRIDWEPLVRLLLDRPSGHADASSRAVLFHALLGQAAIDLAARVAASRPFDAIGLTGGVFQNRRLTEEVRRRARVEGFEVRLARQVPMNDGGLAYGQLIEAIAMEERGT